MRNKRWKFVVGAVVILVVLVWLGFTGVQESKTYYATIEELHAMKDRAYQRRLRVAGDIQPGSIRREGRKVHFTLRQNQLTLPVVYEGTEPLPDTFVDNAQAIADGRFTPEQVFVAKKVQAKCASKYEAAPPGPTQRSGS